jgi:hypothetical protein
MAVRYRFANQSSLGGFVYGNLQRFVNVRRSICRIPGG